jgi:rhodanese-related sulfurtransferase
MSIDSVHVEIMQPAEVAALVKDDPAVRYVDVRTVGEFAQGRPLLPAVNIPFVFHHPLTTAPITNGVFVDLVSHLFAPAARLVLGAADDGAVDPRAEAAAAALVAGGFDRLVVMPAGFNGWRAALLPTTRDNRDGVSYVSLLTRFRRKDKRAGKGGGGH